jgi:glyoxylase-like metal-dependent hydrolase (beta-lactamase superfamily II)
MLAIGAITALWMPAVSAVLEPAQRGAPPASDGLRLYVFNCGQIIGLDPNTWGFKPGELARPDAAVPCHLIKHPKGTLIWDAGVVPDEEIGTPAARERAGQPLRAQLAAIGYAPQDITYLALSHYHVDHAANANAFSKSTWLVRRAERDAMFGATPPPVSNPRHFSALKDSKTIILDTEEYDVFGDGSVVIKAAVGHTPGHQVLVLRLPRSGAVVLAGDLYHFPEQRGTDKVPTFEFNKEQTLQSRSKIEAFVKRIGAQLWIEHDFAANAALPKSPRYYE